jgi:hypothetical protein
MARKINPDELAKIWQGKVEIGGKPEDIKFPKNDNMPPPDFNTLLKQLPNSAPLNTMIGSRKKVLVISPINVENPTLFPRQLKYAKFALKDSLMKKEAPLSSILMFSDLLDLRIAFDYDQIMITQNSWMKVCDLIAVYSDYDFAPNVLSVINQARLHMKRIEYRLLGKIAG